MDKIEDLLRTGDLDNINLAYYLNKANNIMSFYEFFILLLGCSLSWDKRSRVDNYCYMRISDFRFSISKQYINCTGNHSQIVSVENYYFQNKPQIELLYKQYGKHIAEFILVCSSFELIYKNLYVIEQAFKKSLNL